MNSNTVRSFISLPLPDFIINDLFSAIDNLGQRVHNVKWIKKNKCHITVVFLGDLTEWQIDKTIKAMCLITKKIRIFNITLNFIQTMFSEDNPKVIAASVKTNSDLNNFYKDIENGLISEGIGRKYIKNIFVPHITLGRLSMNCKINFKSIKINTSFKAGQVDLMKSSLTSQGSKYSIIKSFKLSDG